MGQGRSIRLAWYVGSPAIGVGLSANSAARGSYAAIVRVVLLLSALVRMNTTPTNRERYWICARLGRRLGPIEGAYMRLIYGMLFFICCSSVALARDTAPDPVTYADGAIGTAPVECGVGDPCAVLKLAGGDTITIYNGGGPHCQAYTLNVVRTHGETVLFQNQLKTDDMATDPWLGGDRHPGKCYAFRSTYLVFDGGIAHLGLFQAKDGSLFGEWKAGH